MMGHNVWHHINAVQEANRQFDGGCVPKAMFNEYTGITIVDIVDAVFSTNDFDERIAILDHYNKDFMRMPGARGMGGKKTIQSKFDSMFDLEVSNKTTDEISQTKIPTVIEIPVCLILGMIRWLFFYIFGLQYYKLYLEL